MIAKHGGRGKNSLDIQKLFASFFTILGILRSPKHTYLLVLYIIQINTLKISVDGQGIDFPNQWHLIILLMKIQQSIRTWIIYACIKSQ